MLSIVVAVLFALAVEAWWSDWQAQQKAEDVLLLIEKELQANLVMLEDSKTHHKSHLDFYKEYQEPEGGMTDADYQAIFLHIFRRGVFRPAQVTQTGWDIARYTDSISWLDFETLQHLNDVFTLQSGYKDYWSRGLLGFTLADVLNDSKEVKIRSTMGTLNQAWWLEISLHNEITEALEHIAAQRGDVEIAAED